MDPRLCNGLVKDSADEKELIGVQDVTCELLAGDRAPSRRMQAFSIRHRIELVAVSSRQFQIARELVPEVTVLGIGFKGVCASILAIWIWSCSYRIDAPVNSVAGSLSPAGARPGIPEMTRPPGNQ